MRYCNQCHRMTAGEPIYCNFCGRSYDVKLCPHRHPNPRNAEICSQCGSRELSIPHPRVPIWLKLLLELLTILPGVLLLVITVGFAIAFLNALARDPQLLFQAMLTGLMLALVWYLYLQLPAFLKHFIARLFRRSRSNHHEH